MTYQTTLPHVFPFVTELDRVEAGDLIEALLATDARHPTGSSFAVTVDGVDLRQVKLWLSVTSLARLRETFEGHRLHVRGTKEALGRE